MSLLDGFMHGVNLGGWLSQCVHTKEHYDSFISEADIKQIAGWGADHVRLPIDYELVETEEGAPIEAGYAYIDACIAWCRKYGLNLILDLHKTAGYVFDNQNASADFFDSPECKERFLHLWEKLATRFVKDKDILILELLNEVVDPNAVSQWNQLIERATAVIRGIDPDVKIMYGGVCYNSVTMVKLLEKPKYDNIIFNFHCYEPVIFTHQGAYWVEGMPQDFRTGYPNTLENYIRDTRLYMDPVMGGNLEALDQEKGTSDTLCDKSFFRKLFQDAVDTAASYQVPLYCGEYGVIDLADPDSTVRWFRDITSVFNEYGIGRAAWSYKKMDFGLIDEHYASIKDELIKLL